VRRGASDFLTRRAARDYIRVLSGPFPTVFPPGKKIFLGNRQRATARVLIFASVIFSVPAERHPRWPSTTIRYGTAYNPTDNISLSRFLPALRTGDWYRSYTVPRQLYAFKTLRFEPATVYFFPFYSFPTSRLGNRENLSLKLTVPVSSSQVPLTADPLTSRPQYLS